MVKSENIKSTFSLPGLVDCARPGRRRPACQRRIGRCLRAIRYRNAAGVFYPFLLSPQIAALAMSGSSALVVIDALLLERTKLEGIRTATKAVASDASFLATPSRPGEVGPAAVGDSSGSDRVLPSST